MRHRRPLACAGAVALALGAYAGPAGAETPEGLAEFETTGSRLEITAPADLETVPSLIPEREDFAFLGEAGDLVWVAGTVDGATFPTLDATGVDGDLDVRLDKVDGPGDAWLYTFAGPGLAEPLATTADSETFELDAGTTALVVLAVDAPGGYTLELHAEATTGPRGYMATTANRTRPQTGGGSATATYSLTAEDAKSEEVTATLADGSEPPSGNAQTATACEIIGGGHVDIGPRFADGEWTAQLRDDHQSESVWRSLEDVVLQVPDAALFPIPGGDYGFLGETGDEIWMLPQTQQSDVVWPGWNTQDSSVIDAVPGSVDWNLVEVSGPGEFTIFLTGTFGGADILFDSGEPLPQTVSIPRNTHAHGNWTFSKAGVYRLTVEFSATTGDGDEVADERVIQLAVGDQTEPAEACDASGGGGEKDSDEDGGSGGFLPTTGTGWILWGLTAAAIAVAVGALIMVLTRRRRHRHEPGDADAR